MSEVILKGDKERNICSECGRAKTTFNKYYGWYVWENYKPGQGICPGCCEKLVQQGKLLIEHYSMSGAQIYLASSEEDVKRMLSVFNTDFHYARRWKNGKTF